MEDKELVALFWEREEKALTETSRKYGPYLYKVAYNVLADPEDAEESVNDTYYKTWNAIPTACPTVLSTFLARITRQTAIDKWRKRMSRKRGGGEYQAALDELEECVAGGETPEEAVDRKELAEAIDRFLFAQSEEARDIFLCRYFYADSVKDIALATGSGEGRIKTVLFRMRKSLREYLEKEGYGE